MLRALPRKLTSKSDPHPTVKICHLPDDLFPSNATKVNA